MRNPIRILAVTAFVGFASATGALAQVSIGGGVIATNSIASPPADLNILDLGSAGVTGWVSKMPLSVSYSNVDLLVDFNGADAGVAWGSSSLATAPADGNYLLAKASSIVSLNFSGMQNYLSFTWGSADSLNQVKFFNGSELVASTTGASLAAYGTRDYAFNFTETGFTRAEFSGFTFEVANVAFAGPAPEVAPIPLNAASMGGLMSFLMMLGMWGKGGARHMLRMAFASITPRRRGLA